MPHQRLHRRRADLPRVVAYRVLRAVTTAGAYTNLETAKALDESRLQDRDAAFATELILGTTRLQGTYDRIIAAASGRRPDALQPDVTNVLRLGAHQLLSMRVPTRAAVAATVELAGAEVGEKVVGLTNAVLRKIAARDLDGWVALLSRDEDQLGAMATRTHHPRWIAEVYADLLGPEAEQALAANNVNPVPTLAVRPGLATVAELDGEPARFSPFGAYRPGNPADVAAVREGRAGVQDEGSQIVAMILGADADAGPWLDLCAGPGGKAALLAGLARQGGARLVAADVAEHRARLVQQALRGYRGEAAPVVVVADSTRPPWAAGSFTRVMADVPCTGLGALRRRPEARWRRRPADVAELVPLQKKLLWSALDAATDGGSVAYVTCSPHPRETVEVVSDVLARHPRRTTLAPAHERFPVDGADLDGGRFLQLWPHRHGTDAMFLALLRVGPD